MIGRKPVDALSEALNKVFGLPGRGLAGSGSGHLAEHKEDRRELAKWGDDLRQTYRTVAQAAGTADLDIHLLMNHAVPGVNAGYITRSKPLNDHLRHQQEAISRVIFDAVRRNRDRLKPAVANWPLVPARTAVKELINTRCSKLEDCRVSEAEGP